KVLVKGVRQRHADVAGGAEVHRSAVGVGGGEQLHGSLGAQVGVFARDVQLVQGGGTVLQADAEGLGALELNALQLKVDAGELGPAAERGRPLERALYGDRPRDGGRCPDVVHAEHGQRLANVRPGQRQLRLRLE